MRSAWCTIYIYYNKGDDCVDNYTAYIKKVIVETIAATEDEKLLQYVYTMLMSALSSPDL